MIDVYGISESGKKVKVGQVDESQIVRVTGVTTDVALKNSAQANGTATVTYNDNSSYSYSYTVRLSNHAVTCSAPGTFTFNHSYNYSASYEAWYYDYTEDGIIISDILMAMVGGGATN